jgi:thioredoxin
MSDKIIHLTDDSFDTDVLKADGLILVDFWAEWCGPCKMIAPILDEIADEYQGKLTVAKLNIDQNPDRTKIRYPWSQPCCCSKTAKWRRPKWARCPKVN